MFISLENVMKCHYHLPRSHPVTLTIILVLLVTSAVTLPTTRAASAISNRCPQNSSSSDSLLLKFLSRKKSACIKNSLYTKKFDCHTKTCCVSSDCDSAKPLDWVCSCDERCGVSRCFLLADTCGKLRPPNGGYYVKKAGGAVKLQCNRGYKRVGAVKRRCESGRWSADKARCIATCKRPSLPQHAISDGRLRKLYFNTNTVRAYCKPGYKLAGDRDIAMTCRNGNWKPKQTRFRCVLDPDRPCCQLPQAPANGSVQFFSGNSNRLCQDEWFQYRCDQCFTLSTTVLHHICRTPGESFPGATCQRVTCQAADIPDVTMNRVLPRGRSSFFCGEWAEVECASLQRLIYTCVRNGSWVVSSDSPIAALNCTDPHRPCCQLPQAPANGSVQFLSSNSNRLCQGERFRYRCHQCFTLSTTALYHICRTPGESFPGATCQRVTCQTPGLPEVPGARALHGGRRSFFCGETTEAECALPTGSAVSTGQRLIYTCVRNGSWVVSPDSPIPALNCTPSAVQYMRLDVATPSTLQLSWLSPAYRTELAQQYVVEMTAVQLGGRRNGDTRQLWRRYSYLVRDRSYQTSNGRFQITIRDLSSDSLYKVAVTVLSVQSIVGGSSSIQGHTQAAPVWCRVQQSSLFVSWDPLRFPAHSTYQVSYYTLQSVVEPYSARRTYRPAVASHRGQHQFLAGVQPFTTYTLQLSVTTAGSAQHRAIRCRLESDTIKPRPPARPIVQRKANDTNVYAVTLYPSVDVFVRTYELVIRAYGTSHVLINSWKQQFEPAEVHRTTGRRYDFHPPQLGPLIVELRFEVIAVATGGGRSATHPKIFFLDV